MKSTPLSPARIVRPRRELALAVVAIGSRASQEREPLLRSVATELQNRLRSRAITVNEYDPFREIDLRNVTAEQVRVTLDEMRRRRPVVVAVIGQGESRSVPADVLLDRALLKYYPWLEQIAHAGHSLPEIVVMEGVLANPLMAGRALLLAPYGEPEGPDRSRRVRARAAAAGIRVIESPDREGMFAAAREGVLAIAERLFADGASSSPLEMTRRAQEAFAASRRYAYVPVGDIAERLKSLVDGDGPPVMVTGESGSGKSALLANWAFTRRLEEPTVFIIEHYAGAESTRASHIGLLRRVIDEIRQRYTIDEELPVSEREIIESFPLWLARVQRERLILILDGLNQLVDGGGDLSWLPVHIPPLVRVIASATDGPARTELARRGWEQIRMRPLTAAERRRVVTEFLGDRGVALDPDQLRRVSDATTSSNPLFLRMRLEELRAPGPLGDLSARIDGYFDATDLEGLFRKVLERLEETHGERLVSTVFTLLNASRRGLSESELQGLIPEANGGLPALLADLDFHLIQRAGLYTFFHDRMRQAVESQYPVPDGTRRRSIHLGIARYFESQPMSARRADEEAWQYRQARADRKLRALITDLSAFLELSAESREYELLGYWRDLGATARMAHAYERALRQAVGLAVPHWTLLYRVGVFLYHAGEFASAEPLLARAEEAARAAGAAALDEVRRNRVALLLELGRYTEVIDTCRSILADREREPDAPTRISAMIALADALHYAGDLDAAEEITREAVSASERFYGATHPVSTEALFNLAMLLADKDESLTAEALFRRVLEVERRAFGEEHPTVAATLSGLADVLRDTGSKDEAEQCTRRGLEIRLRVLGPEHVHTAQSMNQLAGLADDGVDSAEARRLYSAAHRIFQRQLGSDHPYVATVESNIGTRLMHEGNYAEARVVLEKAYASLVASLGEAHPTSLQVASRLCNALRGCGELTRTLELSRSVHAGLMNSVGPRHSLTAEAAVDRADAELDLGELDVAEDLVTQAMPILGEQPGFANGLGIAKALAVMADIQLARKRFAEAARIARQAIGSLEAARLPSAELHARAERILSSVVTGQAIEPRET